MKVLLLWLIPLLFSCCASLEDLFRWNQQPEGDRILVKTIPPSRPEFVDNPTGRDALDNTVSVTGVSPVTAMAKDAREFAREDARQQIVHYLATWISSQSLMRIASSGLASDTINGVIRRSAEVTSLAEAVVSRVSADSYYTEYYLNGFNQEEFVVYVWARVPREFAEKSIDAFLPKLAEQIEALGREKFTAIEFDGTELTGQERAAIRDTLCQAPRFSTLRFTENKPDTTLRVTLYIPDPNTYGVIRAYLSLAILNQTAQDILCQKELRGINRVSVIRQAIRFIKEEL